MKIIKALLFSITMLLVLSVPVIVAAPTAALFEGSKDQACAGTKLNDTGCTENQGVTQVNNTIKVVINWLSIIVGLVSVVMIMIGGIRFVTSQGNAQSVTAARNTVLFAIVGLVVTIMAQLIIKFVIGRSTT